MIRVNLLPVKRKKKPKALPGFVVVAVLLNFITIIVLGVIFYNVKDEVNTLNARKTANVRKISQLKGRLKELNKYEQLVRSVEEKKKLIIQLRKKQSIPVKLLDEVSRNLPNGIWLTTLTFKGRGVGLTGYAFTNSDVVKFVNNLKKSKLLTGVSLAESKREVVKQRDIKERVEAYWFKIRMNVRI
ncbi:MAG TPA: hypothetical protein ENH07_08975 [Nitrospirae bacterium]|nr:hypothetical protein [Nitrospirota bacterium]HDY71756.1 hypothetical protein [Nitrospirota bacterium]